VKNLHPFDIAGRAEDAALKLENATAMKRIDSTHPQVRIETTASAPKPLTSNPEKPLFMYSLYYVLTDQHREEFAPVRGNQQTVSRLVRYFEDVVIENKLSALVIEARCLNGDPTRETQRLAKLVTASRRVYLFSGNSECTARTWAPQPSFKLTNVEEGDHHSIETGPFILVMEPRFCGLLASSIVPDERNSHTTAYEMVWTFDPNVVFTAVEYLMGRMNAQRPEERDRFEVLLNACTPRSSSLRLALTFTTKVTMLMQRQNELEMATNRISSAISSTLELEPILQSAVEEVGRALNARTAAVVLWQEGTNVPESMSIYERPEEPEDGSGKNETSLGAKREGAGASHKADHDAASTSEPANTGKQEVISREAAKEDNQERPVTCGSLEVPISYRNTVIGMLVIEDDVASRNWEDEEMLMVKTVCDQLSVAISHARLFRQVQTQAMTDALTGLYNHRYFQERLEREIKLADRNNEQVSLILLDLDHLKHINDTHGHRSGDAALCHVASMMQSAVREVDISARYGGEEFVVILPQCNRESAIDVAERLRESIASTPVERMGQVTASIGVATYPSGAKNKEELIEMADRAMYLAKAAGRNRVRTLAHRSYTGVDV
jgi:diguanylate cyclase (GGDEF)-like protein